MSQTLQQFFKEVKKTDLLTRDQEVELAKKILQGDQAARNQMIKANIRLAISIAKMYQNRGSDLEDLIQEATLGLMKAVSRFDYKRGFKFSTYASWWIKQAVSRHVATHSRTIRIPSHASGLRMKIDRAVQEYKREFDCLPSDIEIADMLGVSLSAVESAQLIGKCTVSLTEPTGGIGGEGKTLQEIIPDESNSVDMILENQEIVSVVRKTLNCLTEREEKILRLRFGISEEDESDLPQFAITSEEIDQIHKRLT